jgi:hypothetical protein
MTNHANAEQALQGDPTLVVLRRLGNDQRSLRGQLQKRLQAVRTAQTGHDAARADRQLAQLVARMRAKQEELVATAAALPDDVRARHRNEVTAILGLYARPATKA